MEHRVDQLNRLNRRVLEAVRQQLGAESEDDTSKDDIINTMSSSEIFDSFLIWEGIIGYTETIKSAIERIYRIKLVEKL